MTRTTRLLLLLLTAATLLSSALNLALELQLRPAPDLARTTERQPGPPPSATLSAERLAALTGLSLQPTPPSPLSVDARLLGTLVSAGGFSLASVLEGAASRPRSVHVGDELGGATVLAIERDTVLLSSGARVDCRADHDARAGLVQPLGTDHFRVDLSDPARLADVLRGVRVVPAFLQGGFRGLKLFGVQPGSALAQLGLANGDVIASLGGRPLSTPEDALAALAALQAGRPVAVELDRQGDRRSLTLRL